MAIFQAANRLQRGGGSVVINADGTISVVGDITLTGAIIHGAIDGADVAGAIEWDGSNFRGYDGAQWLALDVQAASGGGFTDDGTIVRLTLATDDVHLGAATAPGAKLKVTGNVIVTGTFAVEGVATFSNAAGLSTDIINERTGGTGVSIDGVLLKDSVVTAALVGNASTATVLATARTINGVAFDGSGNIVVTAAAGTLSGATLKSTVLASSLTSLGTIASLAATAATIGALTVSGDQLFSSADGNLAIGTAALGTTATDGFIYISTSAGTPTGVPTTFTGRAPIHWDSTNDIFYVYDGGWVAVTGGGGSGDITRVDITGGVGLLGDLNTTTGDHIQTLNFDADSLGALASGLLAGDHIVVADGTVSKKALISGINLGIFNNDQSWTANAGTVTDVTGGTGIDSSGGATPDLTLDLSELSEITSGLLTTDHLAVSDAGVSVRALISGINLGIFNNDQSWTANVGTVTDVTGGVGIDSTGGATPDLTLDLSEPTELASGLLATDHIAVADNGVTKKALISGIPLTIFNNDLGAIVEVSVTVFGPTDDVTTGNGKAFVVIPSAPDGFNLTAVHAEVMTAGTTGTTDIQIHNIDGPTADMLSTVLTIDSGETGSDTAAAAAVIDTAEDDMSEHDVLRIDVDAVSTTAPKGLIVRFTFELP